ncbi:MAG: pilus assembly protein [Bacilli bacterium]|nr:pilus assembly protein [Bacilli bacterium]
MLEGVTMTKKKGQALVEFIIILPIFLFLLFAIIDFGKILYTKNNLETKMDEVIEDYKNDISIDTINNQLKKKNENQWVELKNEENFLTFSLKEEISIITPGLNLILKNPFEVTTERSIKNES